MGSWSEMRSMRWESPFLGVTLIAARPTRNSSYEREPSPLVSSESNSLRISVSSMVDMSISAFLITFFSRPNFLMTSWTVMPSSISAIASTNCSVVSPVGPHRSRVPRLFTNASWMHSRILVMKPCSSSGPLASNTECWTAPMSASTRPSGFSDVSLPLRCAFHMSVTVPCEASNSLMREPSGAFPTRLEVMNPGERWIWAISSVSMSPS
mmetsp:Transcript_52931/g.125982  ORF Transcript_52931/g.125982 Transcript_52931/m.125982 type:complete len:210 (+) Transcript_52931:214-843(+)